MILAVLISSSRCTWEVWRALKKSELLLRIFRALQTSRVHPITRYTHAKHEQILYLGVQTTTSSTSNANV